LGISLGTLKSPIRVKGSIGLKIELRMKEVRFYIDNEVICIEERVSHRGCQMLLKDAGIGTTGKESSRGWKK
jgi:hypothetical protein